MTSPDRQVPFGSLAPDALSTLQDLIASPIGEEATEVLGTLAEFGNSLVARFFQGYTSITDVFAHAFDELGAELGGIPGMSGVTVWVQSIEELVGTAMGLIDGVFDGIQTVVDGLSFAVTGNGIEGNIAEGMNAVVEGLTMFLKLVNLAMDLIQELIDGVLGVAGGTMSQLVAVLSWVIGVANQFLLFFHGIYDVFGDLLDFAPGGDRPLAALLAGLPKLLSVFSPLDAGKLFGEIPSALLQGVQDAIDGVSDFLQDLVNAILRAIRGIPVVGGTLADIIAEVGGLNDRAVEAKSTADAAQSTAVGAASASLALMETASGEWKLTKQQWTPGTYTWNVDKTPTPGYEIVGYDLITVAGGDSGGVPGLRTEGAHGGLPGGYRRKRIPIADMPNTVTVVVGPGGAAKSGAGRGNSGSPTRFTGLCESPQAGQSVIDTLFGDVPCADRPGRGGDSGGVIEKTDSGGSTTYTATNGQDGENSLDAAGGALGTSGQGWFGGSPTNPTAGGSPTQPADDVRCGAGGGGAGGRTGTAGGVAGGAGGDPGGGGGASGSWANNFYSGGPSGAGGPGRAAAIKVERKL